MLLKRWLCVMFICIVISLALLQRKLKLMQDKVSPETFLGLCSKDTCVIQLLFCGFHIFGLRGEIIPGKNINHLSWGEKNEDEKFSAFSPTFVDCVTRSLEIIEAETHLVRRHKNAEREKKSRRYAKCKGELGQHKDFPCKFLIKIDSCVRSVHF